MQIDSDVRVTGEVAKPIVTVKSSRGPRARGRSDSRAVVAEPIFHRSDRSDDYRRVRGEGKGTYPFGSPLAVSDNPHVGIYDTATFDVRLRLPDDLLLAGATCTRAFPASASET